MLVVEYGHLAVTKRKASEEWLHAFSIFKPIEKKMKRIITLLSISLILLSFSACTSDEPYVPDCHTEEETITEPEANYYIKYLAQGNRNAGWIKSITVNTESGEKTITKQMSSWNETYGPVPKGFQASIKVSGYCEKTYIYVCRGEEPFVIKVEGKSSASYTIDF